jgi:glycerol-3-phosphate dehydrogenase (NAD(P)+)
VRRAAVLGAGSWGTTFAKVLADAGCQVMLHARRQELVDAIAGSRENPDYLPGITLPSAVMATADAEQALHGAAIVVLAVPSQSLRENLERWTPFLPEDATLLSLMKGIELGTTKRMSEVIGEVTGAGTDRIAALSGPNLAR